MNTKQKAIVLLVCSALGNNFIFNNHAMAMKSLKKIFSSVPSQEKTMKLAKLKLDYVATAESLSKSNEEKLAAHVNSIIDERGYIKIGENNVVNPIIYCLKKYSSSTYYLDRFKRVLNWIDEHIPAAFTSRENIEDPNSATPLFFAVNKNVNIEIIKMLAPRSDINAVCKYQNSRKEPAVYISAVELAYTQKENAVDSVPGRWTNSGFVRNVQKEQKVLKQHTQIFNALTGVLCEFTNAVISGNITKIDQAISGGIDINTPVCAFNGKVFTPLEFALMRRDADMFDYLIQRGAKLSEGNTAPDFIIRGRDLNAILSKKYAPSDYYSDYSPTSFKFLKKVLSCEQFEKDFAPYYQYDVDNRDFYSFRKIYLDKELYELYKKRFGKVPKSCLYDLVPGPWTIKEKKDNITEEERIEILNTLVKDTAATIDDLNDIVKATIGDGHLKLLKHLHSLGVKKKHSIEELGMAIFNYGRSLELVKYLVEECEAPIDGTYRGDGLCHAFTYYFASDAEYQPHIVQIAKYLIGKGMSVNSINDSGQTLLKAVQNKYGCSGYGKLGVELYNIFREAGAKINLD